MDVGGWLRSLGLGKYEAAFRDNEIDETVLPNLTADDLKELGVTALGHRRKLLDAIGSDASAKAPSAVAAPAPESQILAAPPGRSAPRRRAERNPSSRDPGHRSLPELPASKTQNASTSRPAASLRRSRHNTPCGRLRSASHCGGPHSSKRVLASAKAAPMN